MRIAIFSDVHGNLTALEAVLADIDSRGADQIVFAGDLCLMGPRPAACVRLVRERAILSVYGNTDEIVIGQRPAPDVIAHLATWTRGQLASEDLDWLAGLPFALRLQPTPNPDDTLLITHANPLDVEQIIYPSEPVQTARYGKVRQPDTALSTLLEGQRFAAAAFGHLHIPNNRQWKGIDLVNISSVSMPGDGDARAKYTIFEWRDGRWSWSRHLVAYDLQAEIDAYRRANPPGLDVILSHIEANGNYFPQRL